MNSSKMNRLCAVATYAGIGAIATVAGAVVSYRHTRFNIRFQPTTTMIISNGGECQVLAAQYPGQVWRRHTGVADRPWTQNEFRIQGNNRVNVGLSTRDHEADDVIRDVESVQAGRPDARAISVQGYGWTCRALDVVPTVTSIVIDETPTQTETRWTLLGGQWKVEGGVRWIKKTHVDSGSNF